MARRSPHAKNLRKGRFSRPCLYYFLTASVAERRKIFSRGEHAAVLLDSIRWLHRARRFLVDAAVVMPDHVHLAGELGAGSLSTAMHSLKSFTANRLASMGVEAPVWQPGFHDHALRDDEDYFVRLRYLIDNPVRSGLVKRAEDYPYLILPDWW